MKDKCCINLKMTPKKLNVCLSNCRARFIEMTHSKLELCFERSGFVRFIENPFKINVGNEFTES